MTQESHADYMERKLSEARDAAAVKRTAAKTKRTTAGAKCTAQHEKLDSLPPDKRAKELLKLQGKKVGAKGPSGNLLNWANGQCQAALTSRYQQAMRLSAAMLNFDETNEAREVVKELIPCFISDSNKFNNLCMVLLELRQHLDRMLEERSSPRSAKKHCSAQRERESN